MGQKPQRVPKLLAQDSFAGPHIHRFHPRVDPTSITLWATGLPSTKQLASCSPAPLWPIMYTRVAAVAEPTGDWGVPGKRRACHGVPPAVTRQPQAAGWLPSNTSFHLWVLIAGEAERACFFFVQFGNFTEVFFI